MGYLETEEKVIQWAHDKGIFRESTALKQAIKTKEEVSELLFALQSLNIATNHDDRDIRKLKQKALMELGDCLVTLINCAHMLNSNTLECLDMAYEKISRRSGAMHNGFFVKEG